MLSRRWRARKLKRLQRRCLGTSNSATRATYGARTSSRCLSDNSRRRAAKQRPQTTQSHSSTRSRPRAPPKSHPFFLKPPTRRDTAPSATVLDGPCRQTLELCRRRLRLPSPPPTSSPGPDASRRAASRGTRRLAGCRRSPSPPINFVVRRP